MSDVFGPPSSHVERFEPGERVRVVEHVVIDGYDWHGAEGEVEYTHWCAFCASITVAVLDAHHLGYVSLDFEPHQLVPTRGEEIHSFLASIPGIDPG